MVVSKMSCVVMLAAGMAGGTVVQSAREVPVVREADVVVVGGDSAAVAAAVAAKEAGAEVFLVAPRSYLGSDLAETRELWFDVVAEFGTEPLAAALFNIVMPYAYVASVAADASHTDTGYYRLTDGVQYSAANGSVQYNGEVAHTLTLAQETAVSKVELYYYVRTGGGGFDTEIVSLEHSQDGAAWTAAAFSTRLEDVNAAGTDTVRLATFLFPAFRAKYVRLTTRPASGMSRQLLDELVLGSAASDVAPGTMYSVAPLDMKREYAAALEQAGVAFLGGSVVTDVLTDGAGKPAGVVIANRSGRQAVLAKAVVDTTEGAWAARRAGAAMRAFTPGTYTFSRVVFAGVDDAPAAAGMTVAAIGGTERAVTVAGVGAPAGMPGSFTARAYRCSADVGLADGSMLELLEVEQAMRDKTWTATCVDQADRLVWMPPDTIVGAARETAAEWTDVEALALGAFRPAGVDYVYVAGVRADVPRWLALEMRNPARLMALGCRIGTEAAAAALARGALAGVALPADTGAAAGTEEVVEFLDGLPPVNVNAEGAVAEGARTLPVLAECDVLVVGAGTAGAPAAVAAARAGADTLILDYLYTMGGVQVDGRIGVYYYGVDCGFTKHEIDPGWKALGAVLATAKAEWYRQACRAEGARVLFGTMAVGALMEGSAVKGVVVVLPDGQRGVIRAEAVVDATGNAVIAALAGEETEYIGGGEPAVQGAGLARHIMGDSYTNSDVGFVNDTDAADLFFFARRAYASMTGNASAWDAGQNPATRERRRLVGAYTVTPLDIMNGRTYPDTIVKARSNFDSHGFTVHDYFFLVDVGRAEFRADLPYRALLPRQAEGLLVTGLGISAHRDAMPILRMQPDVQNQGYAAGYAAALAVGGNVSLRNVNMAALQGHLVSVGILAAADAGAADNFPLGAAAVAAAVEGLTNNYSTLHVVLTDAETALPLLRAAYGAAEGEAARRIYAHVLGMLGDAAGAATLAAAVESYSGLDTGWDFTGMGQYGRSVSLMDSYIIALGGAGAVEGVSPVLAKAGLLLAESRFSHYRAVALAAESLRSGLFVGRLSELLALVRGQALEGNLAAPAIMNYSNTVADAERTACLKELAVARALFRLGDDQHRNGEAVLRAYANDPREVYAAHARAVLAEGAWVESRDGEWIGAGNPARWAEGANWQDGVPASGAGAVVTVTNAAGGAQAIALEGAVIDIGELHVAGADRVLRGGYVNFSGEAPAVEVAAGTRLTLETAVAAVRPLVKEGGGTVAFGGRMEVAGLTVAAGDVAFTDAGVQWRQAYVADTAGADQSMAGTGALRTDFVVNEPILITHLGAYDSDGDGFASMKRVVLFERRGSGSNPWLEALSFAADEAYPLEGGHRFRRLPQPRYLEAGSYSIATFGFGGDDRYARAAAGGSVGGLDGGGGAVTFEPNAYSLSGDGRGIPSTYVTASDAGYGVTAGSFVYAAGAASKVVSGATVLPAGAVLDVGAADVRLDGGLYAADESAGLGTVTNCSAGYPVALTVKVPAGETLAWPAGTPGERADGALGLATGGGGTVAFSGALPFSGGLHVGAGTVELDDAADLGGNVLSFATGGKLLLKAGTALGQPIHVPSQSASMIQSTRLQVPMGGRFVVAGDIVPQLAEEYNGFVVHPCAAAGDAGETEIVFTNLWIGAVDLYLMGDEKSGGKGAVRYEWRDVTGEIRKLAAGHETENPAEYVFGAGCDFSARWLDAAGVNGTLSIRDGARLTVENVRFVDGNTSPFRLDGGTLMVTRFGELGASYGTAHSPVLFNGTRLVARQNHDGFFALNHSSAAPLIADGGALFDTAGYDVAIRGKGFGAAEASRGALVKLGEGTLTVAAPMTYTVPTVVSNGTLLLDLALMNTDGGGVQNALSGKTELRMAAGTVLAVRGAADTNCVQKLAKIVQLDGGETPLTVVDAELAVNRFEGSFVKDGAGLLSLLCDTANASHIEGTLHVREGGFEVRKGDLAVSVPIPVPGFETAALLPGTGIQNDMDKRGTAAMNICPGWVFENISGAIQSGVQRNGSYFSSNSAAHTTNGVQTAFVRGTAYMETALVVALDGEYGVSFEYCPRYHTKWYMGHKISVTLNGVEKALIDVTEQRFVPCKINLGYLPAGSYTLRFTGVGMDGDPCTLIDAVTVEGVSGAGDVDLLDSDTSVLKLDAGVQVNLDYEGAFTVGELYIGGVKQPGAAYYDATTHPAIFTGDGRIRSQAPKGTVLILR